MGFDPEMWPLTCSKTQQTLHMWEKGWAFPLWAAAKGTFAVLGRQVMWLCLIPIELESMALEKPPVCPLHWGLLTLLGIWMTDPWLSLTPTWLCGTEHLEGHKQFPGFNLKAQDWGRRIQSPQPQTFSSVWAVLSTLLHTQHQKLLPIIPITFAGCSPTTLAEWHRLSGPSGRERLLAVWTTGSFFWEKAAVKALLAPVRGHFSMGSLSQQRRKMWWPLICCCHCQDFAAVHGISDDFTFSVAELHPRQEETKH